VNWLRKRLVDDWRDCWRWASMRFCLSNVAFNVIAAALLKGITVSVAFVGFVDLVWLPVIALALAVLAMAGRLAHKQRNVKL
jgi:hypothetical protein